MSKSTRPWRELRAERFPPDKLAELDREVVAELLELDLRELRKARGLTQQEMAQAAAMAQSEVSRIERREDYLLSTLRRVVAALDGELEVISRFEGQVVRLRTTASDIEPKPAAKNKSCRLGI